MLGGSEAKKIKYSYDSIKKESGKGYNQINI
jgi:hypothetical protein